MKLIDMMGFSKELSADTWMYCVNYYLNSDTITAIWAGEDPEKEGKFIVCVETTQGIFIYNKFITYVSALNKMEVLVSETNRG